MNHRRLDYEEYPNLHRRVSSRDGWRCQVCGALSQLQVHHFQSRAQLGPDIEENLITLCCRCHRAIHLNLAFE